VHSLPRVTARGGLLEHIEDDVYDDVEDAESEEKHLVVLGCQTFAGGGVDAGD